MTWTFELILLSSKGFVDRKEGLMADKTKKPIYKRIWFWVLIVLVIGAVGGGVSGNSGSSTAPDDEAATTQEASTDEASTDNSEIQEESEPEVPKEYENALTQAENYSDTLHMSKQGIYDQLVSEYGGQFSPEAAQYAIDNIDADWNANALAKARTYQDTMAMSPNAIYDQLTSEYGEKFTPEEAQYAIDNL